MGVKMPQPAPNRPHGYCEGRFIADREKPPPPPPPPPRKPDGYCPPCRRVGSGSATRVPPAPAAPPPFDEAFEDALLVLMTLRQRAMGESPVAWPALNSACRSLAALWLVTHTGDVLMLRARDAQGAEEAFLRAMAERIH